MPGIGGPNDRRDRSQAAATPIEEVPPDMKPEGGTRSGFPATGVGTTNAAILSGSAVCGACRRPVISGCPATGRRRRGRGTNGFPVTGCLPRPKKRPIFPSRRKASRTGPPAQSAGPNYFWIPGHWQWIGDRYVWQPGYWAAYQPDWIWVPATYCWTPRGWVYVPGYWDYPLARRGLVFSPVYFAGPVAVYRPAICLDAGVFSVSLFCRPAYGHYYFGDYYDDRYVALGIRPCFYYNSPRYGFDPLFSYYRWYHVDHMGEREWDRHLVGWHDYYRAHPDMRPPHTLAEQREALGQPRRDGAARYCPASHGGRRPCRRPAARGAAVRLQVVSPAEHAHICRRRPGRVSDRRPNGGKSSAGGRGRPARP